MKTCEEELEEAMLGKILTPQPLAGILIPDMPEYDANKLLAIPEGEKQMFWNSEGKILQIPIDVILAIRNDMPPHALLKDWVVIHATGGEDGEWEVEGFDTENEVKAFLIKDKKAPNDGSGWRLECVLHEGNVMNVDFNVDVVLSRSKEKND